MLNYGFAISVRPSRSATTDGAASSFAVGTKQESLLSALLPTPPKELWDLRAETCPALKDPRHCQLEPFGIRTIIRGIPPANGLALAETARVLQAGSGAPEGLVTKSAHSIGIVAAGADSSRMCLNSP